MAFEALHTRSRFCEIYILSGSMPSFRGCLTLDGLHGEVGGGRGRLAEVERGRYAAPAEGEVGGR